MKYGAMGFFFLLWAAAAMITSTVAQAADPSSVEGSTADFETFSNTVYAGEETALDRPVSGGSNPVSAAYSFGNAAAGWVTYIFKSAALQSPIWEGWASMIRYAILVLQIPLLIQLLLEGAKVLSGFIPFT